jgi:ribosomal protein L23
MKTHISVFPRTTEKAYGQSKNNVYVFDVPASANKQEIVAAIEAQYNVKTTGIKTLVQTGKAIRFSKGKRAHPGTTNHKDSKKAYVTLAAGDSIKVFEEETATEAKAKTEKKEKK